MKPSLILLCASAALLAGCENNEVKAPVERARCFHAVGQGEGKPPKFNQLPGFYATLEYCAAGLERVRRDGARQAITGAYQGKFIFVERRGLFVGESLTSPRYLALVRTSDGRLAIPGAIPQAPPGMTAQGPGGT
jgi:hypothetical protein